jgi:TonB family protein
MNALLIYEVKTAFYILAFYLAYDIFLSKDTMHSRNRAYILVSLVAALLLPLITIQTSKPVNIPFFGKTLTEVFITGIKDKTPVNYQEYGIPMALQLINAVYITGVVLAGLNFLLGLLKLVFLVVNNKYESGRIIRFDEFNSPAFSALGHIFISKNLDSKEADKIINHEQNHINYHHFLDILLVEIIKVFQWFNPFIHLYDRSLRAVHEYQADECCIKSGILPGEYQRLLLCQIFGSKVFSLNNCFSNPSFIKKRIIMMTKERSGNLTSLKLFAVMPVIAAVMFLFSNCSEKSLNPDAVKSQQSSARIEVKKDIEPVETVKDIESEPFVVVEEMPMFHGGDAALLKFIAEHTQYPESAKNNNIQGRVIVRFCVSSKGYVNRASVLKGVAPELDKEALKVVSSLPQFKPGRQGGKPVPVWYMVPITFTLR